MNAAYLLRNHLPKHGVVSQLINRLFCLTLLIVSGLFTMISARAVRFYARSFMLGDHPEHEADFGEPVILRSEATCMSGFLPLGRGKIFLTGSRLLWYSNAGILNMPFSLWRSSVEIPLAEIDEVTSLVTRSLRVKSRGGLAGSSPCARACRRTSASTTFLPCPTTSSRCPL